MNSTPNYGFETLLVSSDAAIDRELRRVEDRVDASATTLALHGEAIVRSQEKVDCLAARVKRGEEDLQNRYTKDETDCKLAGKADKCAFEKHLADSRAHEELFEGKVDKQDGCRLICEGELREIHHGLEERYTREEVDALLSNRVTDTPPTVYAVEYLPHHLSHKYSYYFKNQYGVVTVCISVIAENDFPITGNGTIGSLPEGFRPAQEIEAACSLNTYEDGPRYTCGTLAIFPNGDIVIRSGSEEVKIIHGSCFSYVATH